MADHWYGMGLLASVLGSGEADPINYLANVIKVGLSSSTHVPNKDDEFLDDVGADDFVDGELTPYTPQTLGSKTLTYDTVNDRVEWDAANTTFTAIDAGTAAQATIYDDTGATTAAKRMLGNVSSGGFPIATNGGDVVIQWNAEGHLQGAV